MFVLFFNSFGSIKKHDIVIHIPIHLPKIFREKLYCSKCEFVTISANRMRKHVKSNCDEIKEKVECVCYCGKVFSSKLRLNYHVTYTHQQKKDHICTICEKAFSFTNQLKVIIF